MTQIVLTPCGDKCRQLQNQLEAAAAGALGHIVIAKDDPTWSPAYQVAFNYRQTGEAMGRQIVQLCDKLRAISHIAAFIDPEIVAAAEDDFDMIQFSLPAGEVRKLLVMLPEATP